MPKEKETGQMPFWQHLDELRYVLLRIVAAVAVCAVVAFILKDGLFKVLLAPQSSSFITYKWLDHISALAGNAPIETFDIKLISTSLPAQFMLHIKTAAYAGLLVSMPYTLHQLFRFVSPALYDNERRYGTYAVVSAYVMFMIGVAVCYMIVFPLTFRFLGTYQVSGDVENMITLQSYVDTFITMNLMMGIVFELPVVCWLMAKMKVLRAGMMRKFRRHALVVILIVAAIITPTSDAFTMIVVSLPIWLLYEISIIIVASTKNA